MLIVKIAIAILSGFAGHQFFTPTLRFGLRWGGMMRSAIGWILALPVFLLIKPSIPKKHEGGDSWEEVGRDVVTWLITGLTFGVGVFLGHLSDRDSTEEQ